MSPQRRPLAGDGDQNQAWGAHALQVFWLGPQPPTGAEAQLPEDADHAPGKGGRIGQAIRGEPFAGVAVQGLREGVEVERTGLQSVVDGSNDTRPTVIGLVLKKMVLLELARIW